MLFLDCRVVAQCQRNSYVPRCQRQRPIARLCPRWAWRHSLRGPTPAWTRPAAANLLRNRTTLRWRHAGGRLLQAEVQAGLWRGRTIAGSDGIKWVMGSDDLRVWTPALLMERTCGLCSARWRGRACAFGSWEASRRSALWPSSLSVKASRRCRGCQRMTSHRHCFWECRICVRVRVRVYAECLPSGPLAIVRRI